MTQAIAEAVIYLAAVAAGVGSLAFLVYLVSLMVREHRERRATLARHRSHMAARRAGILLEAELEWEHPRGRRIERHLQTHPRLARRRA